MGKVKRWLYCVFCRAKARLLGESNTYQGLPKYHCGKCAQKFYGPKVVDDPGSVRYAGKTMTDSSSSSDSSSSDSE